MAKWPRRTRRTRKLPTTAILLVALVALPPTCRAQASTTPAAPSGSIPGKEPGSPDARQQQGPLSPAAPTPSPLKEEAVPNPFAPCVQPPPPVTWHDYKGPFAKTIAVYAQRLERRSVGMPGSSVHYEPGALLCTLEIKDKFWLFVHDSTDPVAFINAAFNAGIDQAQDSQPTFGHSFSGYLDRFGADMATQSSSNFFKDFVYPTIFEEDPRFYRLGRGTAGHRMVHAMSHVVVAHNVNGNAMFNFSEWLGDASVIVLSNTYLPDNRRGVAPVAKSMAISMGYDTAYDILREFWPEIAHKFRLPFRDEDRPNTPLGSGIPQPN